MAQRIRIEGVHRPERQGWIWFNSGTLLGLLVLVLEVLFKLFALPTAEGAASGQFWLNIGVTALFTLPLVIFLTVVDGMLPKHESKRVIAVLAVLISFIFLFQLVFFRIFDVPFSLSSLVMAEAVTEFWTTVEEALLKNWERILIMLTPLIILLISLRYMPHRQLRPRSVLYGSVAVLGTFVVGVASLLVFRGQINGPYNVYFESNNPLMVFEQFGVITGSRVDLQRALFGFTEHVREVPEVVVEAPQGEPDYTGYFKGKNLIFIIMESYNSVAADHGTMPNVARLREEGFVFNNFYTPLFLSTIGGEMQALTGLIPNQSMVAGWQSGKAPDFPYAIGFSFAAEGYETRSYHDWTEYYYSRRVTRPTLGFTEPWQWVGCGNGMERVMNCNQWPTSDLEMIKGIGKDFIGTGRPQATYILPVSGHSPYNFGGGNKMALKNRALVENLPFSAGPRAYLAAQAEFDKMVGEMLRQLEAAGELENTAIIMVADHYPYALDIDEVNELSDYPRDLLFEAHHSDFIVWTPNMPRVEVNKVGSQVDVLPTILSLFDIPYDPNKMAGKNILDPTREGLAIFSNRSWISDRAEYNASTRKWTARGEAVVTQQYIDQMNAVVAQRFALSEQMFRVGY